MVAHINTVAFRGIEAVAVDVEVQITSGLPAFTIVGLADKAVGESRERVRAALSAIGLGLPPKRITVNLAPADLPKEGSHYDLPVALALLVAMEVLPASELEEYVVLGEMGLNADIRSVPGVLPAALHASSLDKGLICPKAQGGEAAWAGGGNVLAPATLIALVNHFKGIQVLGAPEPRPAEEDDNFLDLRDIKGQETAKRALEVAAAGGHNLLILYLIKLRLRNLPIKVQEKHKARGVMIRLKTRLERLWMPTCLGPHIQIVLSSSTYFFILLVR